MHIDLTLDEPACAAEPMHIDFTLGEPTPPTDHFNPPRSLRQQSRYDWRVLWRSKHFFEPPLAGRSAGVHAHSLNPRKVTRISNKWGSLAEGSEGAAAL